MLEKTLESPLDSKEIKPVILKEINPEYSLEGLMLKLRLHNFGLLMQTADSLKKTLIPGKSEGKRTGQQRMRQLDSITDSMEMNLSKLQEIVQNRGIRMLQFTGSWRVRHEIATNNTTTFVLNFKDKRKKRNAINDSKIVIKKIVKW